MAVTRESITAYFHETGTRPNRALGQNFCIDAAALAKVASALPVQNRAVVEIGAGLGALTQELLLSPAERVYAIELDAALASRTGAQLLCPRLCMVLGDVLELDMGMFPPDAVWCGNLPYYITTPIAERLLTRLPPAMALMVQQEAADRFFARPGMKNYGAVAVLTKLYYDADVLLTLPPESYYPQPDVHSAVVRLIRKNSMPQAAPGELMAFVKACLAMRRKTLYNNLSGYPHAADAIQALGLPAGVRGEALTPEEVLALFVYLHQKEDAPTA